MKTIARGHAETLAAPAGATAREWTQTLVEALVVFAVCASLFAFVQFGTSALAGNDAYYHLKMGRLMHQQGLTPQLSLPYSILRSDAFYKHHMLYYVIVLMDVTGVPLVDTQVARVLLQAADAARLLGAEPILVRIRPELAQTIVGLGLDLSSLKTQADLQSGIRYAAQ